MSLVEEMNDICYRQLELHNDLRMEMKRNHERIKRLIEFADNTPAYFGVNFLSYNYITTNVNEAITDVYHAYYFNGWVNKSNMSESLVQPATVTDKGLQRGELYKDSQDVPVTDTNLNTFIVVNEVEASHISVGDYVNNIAYYNNVGEAEKYNLIPGITRVISKVFVNVDSRMEFYYNGKKYRINVAALENSNAQLI